MEGGHPDVDPVPNHHEVSLDWFRTQFEIAYGFAPTWDVELRLPLDVKRQRVRFETPNGQSFENPAGEIHHRDETLEGLADLRLLVNFRPSNLLLDGDTLHLGAGISIPTGRIEDDPFELGALGLRHRHIQFGTGTVDPVFRLGYSIEPDWWGANISFGAHLPLYENRKDYKAPALIDVSVGGSMRITNWLGLSANYVLMYQSRGRWDGESDENTGFTLQGISVSAPIWITPALTVLPRVFYTFSIDTRRGADTFEMDVLLSIGIEWNLGAKERKRPTFMERVLTREEP